MTHTTKKEQTKGMKAMKEDVFRGLTETFVKEMRERTHGDNILVVLVKDADGPSLTPGQRYHRAKAIKTAVNFRFRALAKEMIASRPKSKYSDAIYPENFLDDLGDAPAHVKLSDKCADMDSIESAHVIPYVSHTAFDPLYKEWMRLTDGQLSRSFVVCLEWDVTYTSESRSDVINIGDYAMRKLLSCY